MPRRDEVEPPTPAELAYYKAITDLRRKRELSSSVLTPPNKLPRARYVNQPIEQKPRGGVRSKNAANVEDLRFLEDHPDKPEFVQGLELLNRHRLDRGLPVLDRFGVADEYPGSLASMMIRDQEKTRKKTMEKTFLGAQPLYQWAQPGASTGVTPGATYSWQPR